MSRWSRCDDEVQEGVECYQVVASQGKRTLGLMTVQVIPAKLDYLVLKRNTGSKQVYHNGETVFANRGERLEVVDLKSNVTASDDLALALDFAGHRTRLDKPFISWSEEPLRRLSGRKAGSEVKLLVLREEETIGHVRLLMGGPVNAGK
jgi:hypothetical protein